jgi:hypothetical protein
MKKEISFLSYISSRKIDKDIGWINFLAVWRFYFRDPFLIEKKVKVVSYLYYPHPHGGAKSILKSEIVLNAENILCFPILRLGEYSIVLWQTGMIFTKLNNNYNSLGVTCNIRDKPKYINI